MDNGWSEWLVLQSTGVAILGTHDFLQHRQPRGHMTFIILVNYPLEF